MAAWDQVREFALTYLAQPEVGLLVLEMTCSKGPLGPTAIAMPAGSLNKCAVQPL